MVFQRAGSYGLSLVVDSETNLLVNSAPSLRIKVEQPMTLMELLVLMGEYPTEIGQQRELKAFLRVDGMSQSIIALLNE